YQDKSFKKKDQATGEATAQESFTQIDCTVRLVVKKFAHLPLNHEPVGILKSCVPYATGQQTAVRRSSEKRPTWRRGLMPAISLLHFQYGGTLLMGSDCLTAPPRVCRIAAYRVSRVAPAAYGTGLAEAVWERDKRFTGRWRTQRDGLCLV